jgi:hypothetical protein
MGLKYLLAGVMVVALVLCLSATVFRTESQAQPAAQPAAAGGPKYTIVETDGTNLLVVDNSSNTLYFYTLDQGKEIGDDLHLRGSIDLTQVGKPTITPKKAAK